jgi:thymidylate synthase
MLPFNIASYALLAHIIGKMTNMIPKGIIGDLSNVHIYEPHLDAVKEQLSRDVNKHGQCELDYNYLNEGITWNLNLDKVLDQLLINSFKLNNYTSEPRIPAEMLAYSN